MTTAAAGCITTAEEQIRNMLANCTAFKTWVGAATAEIAKSSIYYDAVPMQDMTEDNSPLAYNVSLRPFALIWTSLTNGITIDKANVTSGLIYIRFEQNTPDANSGDWEEADRLFKNTLGSILLSSDESNPGLWELSRTASYTQINMMRLEALYRTTEDEYDTYGDAQAAEVSIDWGVRQ